MGDKGGRKDKEKAKRQVLTKIAQKTNKKLEKQQIDKITAPAR